MGGDPWPSVRVDLMRATTSLKEQLDVLKVRVNARDSFFLSQVDHNIEPRLFITKYHIIIDHHSVCGPVSLSPRIHTLQTVCLCALTLLPPASRLTSRVTSPSPTFLPIVRTRAHSHSLSLFPQVLDTTGLGWPGVKDAFEVSTPIQIPFRFIPCHAITHIININKVQEWTQRKEARTEP